MKNPLVYLTLILIGLCSCESSSSNQEKEDVQGLEQHLESFKKTFPILSAYDWEILSGYETEFNEMVNLEVSTQSADTTLFVRLLREEYIVEDDSRVIYSITKFQKSFNDNGRNEVIVINGRGTRLFHYYYTGEVDHAAARKFVSGKYFYMSRNGGFTPEQFNYYLAHKDSLNGIVGDVTATW